MKCTGQCTGFMAASMGVFYTNITKWFQWYVLADQRGTNTNSVLLGLKCTVCKPQETLYIFLWKAIYEFTLKVCKISSVRNLSV